MEKGKLQFCSRIEMWDKRVILGLIVRQNERIVKVQTKNGLYSILIDDVKDITKTNEIFDGGIR